MILLAIILVDLAGLAGAVVTALPYWPTHRWWVRAMEFPRMQIALIAALVLIAAVVLEAWTGAILALAALAVQTAWIIPFTPLVPKELRLADGEKPDDVEFLASNVLMQNTDFAAILAEISRVDPDVLLLMETDARWIAAMAPALALYDTVLTEPRDDCYGMILATRLKVRDARLMRLATDGRPSAFAELETPGGTVFRFMGLHPAPPVPGEDTVARDAQVLHAARYAREADMPVVVMGDFNTAAWSRTAHRFKAAGGFLDPRIGRSPLPSFDARSWIMRLPIDQLYLTGDVSLVNFSRGPQVGSDHFPMQARLRFDADLARRLNRDVVPLSDEAEARVAGRVRLHAQRLAARSERTE